MRGAAGLTLLEVIVALSLFTIGILAAVELQARSLANQRRASAFGEVTRMLAAELELQRHTANVAVLADGETTASFPCESAWVQGIEACVVTIERCTIHDQTIVCGASVASGPAYRVRVSVLGRNGEAADVTTVTTSDRFIAGAAGLE